MQTSDIENQIESSKECKIFCVFLYDMVKTFYNDYSTKIYQHCKNILLTCISIIGIVMLINFVLTSIGPIFVYFQYSPNSFDIHNVSNNTYPLDYDNYYDSCYHDILNNTINCIIYTPDPKSAAFFYMAMVTDYIILFGILCIAIDPFIGHFMCSKTQTNMTGLIFTAINNCIAYTIISHFSPNSYSIELYEGAIPPYFKNKIINCSNPGANHIVDCAIRSPSKDMAQTILCMLFIYSMVYILCLAYRGIISYYNYIYKKYTDYRYKLLQ